MGNVIALPGVRKIEVEVEAPPQPPIQWLFGSYFVLVAAAGLVLFTVYGQLSGRFARWETLLVFCLVYYVVKTSWRATQWWNAVERWCKRPVGQPPKPPSDLGTAAQRMIGFINLIIVLAIIGYVCGATLAEAGGIVLVCWAIRLIQQREVRWAADIWSWWRRMNDRVAIENR